MLSAEATDKEILDYSIGGTTIRNLGGMSFMSWIINSLNGLDTYKAETQELVGLAKNPLLGVIPDGEKIRMVKKLIEAGAII